MYSVVELFEDLAVEVVEDYTIKKPTRWVRHCGANAESFGLDFYLSPIVSGYYEYFPEFFSAFARDIITGKLPCENSISYLRNYSKFFIHRFRRPFRLSLMAPMDVGWQEMLTIQAGSPSGWISLLNKYHALQNSHPLAFACVLPQHLPACLELHSEVFWSTRKR